MNDFDYMRIALQLARKGCGWVSPNPMVGAVLVKEDRIIGQGYHQRYGGLHAERNALASCTESPAGATLYVTLEPCCHLGKQPPCTDAVLDAGIARVVVGSEDPNPLVAGHGLALLRQRGVAVTEHVLEAECRQLNQIFFHFIQTKRPYVALKYAMTMDGKIATATGASKWITDEAARAHVQQQRHRYSAVMVGVGTVLADDPRLTCRMSGGRQPLRVICDTRLRTPLSAQVIQTADTVPTLLATCCTDERRQAPYRHSGCQVLVLPEQKGRVDLKTLMETLGARGIDSVMAEGGAELNWSLLEQGLVQKVLVYLAPKLFGGTGAKSPIGGTGISLPSDGIRLHHTAITQLGEDVFFESEVTNCVHRNH